MEDVFKFAVGAAVKVPVSYLTNMRTDLVGCIVERETQDEAEPRYLIAWEDQTGTRDNWWSEGSIELAVQP